MHSSDPVAGLVAPPLDSAREIRRAGLALLGLVLGGTGALMWVEGWDVLHAVFFVLITITTVGYDDGGLSQSGRLIAIPILIGGISVASYSFAVLFQGLVADRPVWRKRMQRKISNLRGHTIVCGYGRIGSTICRELESLGRSVVVIEQSPAATAAALEANLPAIQGNAGDDANLLAAGIEHAANVVSAVDDAADNIVVTLSARQLRPDVRIIARAERDEEFHKLRLAGASSVVSPSRSGGCEFANQLTQPELAELCDVSGELRSGFPLIEIDVRVGSDLCESTLEAEAPELAARVALVACTRPGQGVELSPSASQKLQPGDTLVLAAWARDHPALSALGHGQSSESSESSQSPH